MSEQRGYRYAIPAKGLLGIIASFLPTYALLWVCLRFVNWYDETTIQLAVLCGLLTGIIGLYCSWLVFTRTRVYQWALYADAWFETIDYPLGGRSE